MTHFAHTRKGEPEERWELLEDHLHNVAKTAASFASSYGKEEAYAAGLLHDIGKYRKASQDYIRTDGAAKRVKHSIVGAWWAIQENRFSEALAIAGHHGRLPCDVGFRGRAGGGKRLLEDALRAYKSLCNGFFR